MRAVLLALIAIPAWACATASYDNAPPDSLLYQSDNGGSADAVGGMGPSAGSGASAGMRPGAAGSGPTGGSAQSGGTSGSSSAGKGGTSSGGMGAGKGGSSSAGASSGGTSSSGGAGKGGSSSAGTGAGGTSSAGGNSAGASSAGASSGATCDAAHAVATVTTSGSYTGKASDCVRLVVEPSWSVINVQLQPQPGTQSYPVPFSFFNCGGNGTGSLTADYTNATLKSGANPGCDFFVQFGGGETTIKVTYYD